MIEFKAWPKTPRLFRDVILTEKIDGTNAAVVIERVTIEEATANTSDLNRTFVVRIGELEEVEWFEVGAQSRKRVITPQADNFGFARWVQDNAVDLLQVLDEGRHYGEWWGSGIQRGYGLSGGEKHFSLFNVHRYADLRERLIDAGRTDLAIHLVPILYEGPFDTQMVTWVLEELRDGGSAASPGFMRPEGVVVYHKALGGVFKVTVEGDESPKGLAA